MRERVRSAFCPLVVGVVVTGGSVCVTVATGTVGVSIVPAGLEGDFLAMALVL